MSGRLQTLQSVVASKDAGVNSALAAVQREFDNVYSQIKATQLSAVANSGITVNGTVIGALTANATQQGMLAAADWVRFDKAANAIISVGIVTQAQINIWNSTTTTVNAATPLATPNTLALRDGIGSIAFRDISLSGYIKDEVGNLAIDTDYGGGGAGPVRIMGRGLTFSIDNLYDIGISGQLRPRNIYMAGGIYFANHVWNWSEEGQQRLFFATNSHTYIETGDEIHFRNSADNDIVVFSSAGSGTFQGSQIVLNSSSQTPSISIHAGSGASQSPTFIAYNNAFTRSGILNVDDPNDRIIVGSYDTKLTLLSHGVAGATFDNLGNATFAGAVTAGTTFTGGDLAIGISTMAGDDSGSTTRVQYLMAHRSGITTYRAAIRTQHDSSTTANNTIRFYTWQTSQAATDIGNNLALTLSGAGNILPSTVAFKSNDFSAVDPIIGFNLLGGTLTINGIIANTLHVKAFIADIEQALAGSQIISKSVAKVAADVSINSSGGQSFSVESFEGFPNTDVFVANDTVRFRVITRATGSLDVTDTWVKVTGTASYNPDGTVQTWHYTFLSGTDPVSIKKGQLVLDYGVVGNGIWETVALGPTGAGFPKTPYAQSVIWVSGTTPVMQIQSRLGDLTGITDTSLAASFTGLYGLYSGNAFLKGNLIVTSPTAVALGASSIAIGNITGTANSAIKLANTPGTPATSGLFGYDGAGTLQFKVSLDGSAQLGYWEFSPLRLINGHIGAAGSHSLSINKTTLATTDWYADLATLEGFEIKWLQSYNAGTITMGQLVTDGTTGVKTNFFGIQMQSFGSPGYEWFALGGDVNTGYGSPAAFDAAVAAGTAVYARIAGWTFTPTQFQSSNLSGGGDGTYTTAGIAMNKNGWVSSTAFALGTTASSICGWKMDSTVLWKEFFDGITSYYQIGLNSSQAALEFSRASTSQSTFQSAQIRVRQYYASTFGEANWLTVSLGGGIVMGTKVPDTAGEYATIQMKYQFIAMKVFNATSYFVGGIDINNNIGLDANGRTPFVQLSRTYDGTNNKTWYLAMDTTGVLGLYENTTRRMHVVAGGTVWVAN